VTGYLRTAKLADIAQLNPALSGVLRAEDQVSFIPMSAVDADAASTHDAESRCYSEVRKGYTPFLDGDVLVAKITPCFENGKIAQARLNRRVGFGSTEFHVVRARADQADARYLLHFLRQDRIRREGERKMTGSAGQRRVPEHFLAGLDVPLPFLSEQRRIADILDRAETMRAKRRVVLAGIDTLTRSLFLDLLEQAGRSVPMVSIEDGMEAIIDYRGKSPNKTESGVPLITARVVKGGELLEPTEFIAEADYDVWMRRGLPKAGDVVFTTEAPLGEVAQLDERKVALAQRLLVLRGKPALIDNTYLKHALTAPEVRKQIDARSTGSTVLGIRQRELRKVMIPIPSVALQREFGHRVGTVEKLKAAHRASLSELGALFASLEHRAFRGEL
jgi:type I restriction enzyme, S subunit